MARQDRCGAARSVWLRGLRLAVAWSGWVGSGRICLGAVESPRGNATHVMVGPGLAVQSWMATLGEEIRGDARHGSLGAHGRLRRGVASSGSLRSARLGEPGLVLSRPAVGARLGEARSRAAWPGVAWQFPRAWATLAVGAVRMVGSRGLCTVGRGIASHGWAGSGRMLAKAGPEGRAGKVSVGHGAAAKVWLGLNGSSRQGRPA